MTTRTWLSTTSANWATTADWSGNTIPGNGSNTDDALIAQAGTYTVTVSDGESPNSVVLDGASATLVVGPTGVLAPASSIDLMAGTLAVAGTIVGGAVLAAGGTFEARDGTLFGVVWRGTLALLQAGNINIADGISLTDLAGTGPGTIEFDALDAGVSFTNSATLDGVSNTQTLAIDVAGNGHEGTISAPLTAGTSVTFGPNAFVQVSGNNSTLLLTGLNIINDTTIEGGGTADFLDVIANLTNSASSEINIDAMSFSGSLDNAGVVLVSGTVGFDGPVTNSGTFTAGQLSAGPNVVAGPFSNSGTLTIGNTGGTTSFFVLNSTFANSNEITFGSNIQISASGNISLSAAFTNLGTLTLGSSDTLTLSKGTGDGTVNLGNLALLDVGRLSGNLDGTVVFQSTRGTIKLENTGTFDAAIEGFRSGSGLAVDTIDVTGKTLDTFSYTPNANPATGGTVQLLNGSTLVEVLTLAGADYSAAGFHFTPDGATGTDVTTDFVACYRAGTRIQTGEGETPVERLSLGDRVRTSNVHGAQLKQVIWLGHREIDCSQYDDPSRVWPVRVVVGAFANGLPKRELWVSPDHAVFVDGVLIPIHHLINGSTIMQEPVDEVTYYHVELAAHDVILAEGLPCESYLDTGNRGAFESGATGAGVRSVQLAAT